MATIDLPDIIGNFTSTLADTLTKNEANLILNRSEDNEGNQLDSTFWLTLDEGTAAEEHMIVTLTGSSGVIVKRGLSKTDVNTEVEANKEDQDRGAPVKITNIGLIAINRLLKGTDTFNAVDWKGVNSIDDIATPAQNELNKAANVEFVLATALAAAPDASEAIKGVTKLSVAADVIANPIAVGDNDTRVPTQDENDALQGTSGAPADANRYVTSDDVSDTATASKIVRRDAEGKIAGEDTVTTILTHTVSENITAGQVCVKTIVSDSVGTNGGSVNFGTTATEQVVQEITFPHDTVFSSVILNLSKVGSPDDLEVQLLDENDVQLVVKKVGSLVATGEIHVVLGAHKVTANTVYKLRIGQENDGTSDVNFYQLETNVLDEVNFPNWIAKSIDNNVETPLNINTNVEVFYEGVLAAQAGVAGRDPLLSGSEGSLMVAESDIVKGSSGKFVVDGVAAATNVSYSVDTNDLTVYNQTQQGGNSAAYSTGSNNSDMTMTYFMGRYMTVHSFSIKVFTNFQNSGTLRVRFNKEGSYKTIGSWNGATVGNKQNGGTLLTFDNIRLTAPRVGSSFTISALFQGGGGDQGFIASTADFPSNAESVPFDDGGNGYRPVSDAGSKGNHPAGKLVFTDKVDFYDGCAVYLSSTQAGSVTTNHEEGCYVGKAAGHEKLYVNSPQHRQQISTLTISIPQGGAATYDTRRVAVPPLTTQIFSSNYGTAKQENSEHVQTTNHFVDWETDFLCVGFSGSNNSTRLTFFS